MSVCLRNYLFFDLALSDLPALRPAPDWAPPSVVSTGYQCPIVKLKTLCFPIDRPSALALDRAACLVLAFGTRETPEREEKTALQRHFYLNARHAPEIRSKLLFIFTILQPLSGAPPRSVSQCTMRDAWLQLPSSGLPQLRATRTCLPPHDLRLRVTDCLLALIYNVFHAQRVFRTFSFAVSIPFKHLLAI